VSWLARSAILEPTSSFTLIAMMLLMYSPTSFHLHQVLTFHEKIFASHGIGGIIGNILTALFAQKSIAAADGTVISGGWLDCHYIQLAVHIAGSSVGLAYSLIMTVSIAISYPVEQHPSMPKLGRLVYFGLCTLSQCSDCMSGTPPNP
jgi:ammonia channel protein AmtB